MKREAAILAAGLAAGGAAEAHSRAPHHESAHSVKAEKAGDYAGKADRIKALMANDDEASKTELLQTVSKLRKRGEVKQWIKSPESDELLRVVAGAVGDDDSDAYELLSALDDLSPAERAKKFEIAFPNKARRDELVLRAQTGAMTDVAPPAWVADKNAPYPIKVAGK